MTCYASAPESPAVAAATLNNDVFDYAPPNRYAKLYYLYFSTFLKCYSTLRKEKYLFRTLVGFQEAWVRVPLCSIFYTFSK